MQRNEPQKKFLCNMATSGSGSPTSSQVRACAIVAGGTRGDVQPYLALALELGERGFRVHLLCDVQQRAPAEIF